MHRLLGLRNFLVLLGMRACGQSYASPRNPLHGASLTPWPHNEQHCVSRMLSKHAPQRDHSVPSAPHLALPSFTCSGSPFMLLDVDAVHAPAAESLTAGTHLFLLRMPPLLLRDHHGRRGTRAPCPRAGVPLWGAHLAGGGWGARTEASAESWHFALQRGPAAKSLPLITLGIGSPLNCGPSDGYEMAPRRCFGLNFPSAGVEHHPLLQLLGSPPFAHFPAGLFGFFLADL